MFNVREAVEAAVLSQARVADVWSGSEVWVDELNDAIAVDDAPALAALLVDMDAWPLDRLDFDVDIGGRQVKTKNILAQCCFKKASDCAKLLIRVFEGFTPLKGMVVSAAHEVLSTWDESQSGDAKRCATALSNISVGQGIARLTHMRPEQLHLPIVPKNRTEIARLTLDEFAQQKFCDSTLRREAIRAGMRAIASGDQIALPDALATMKKTAPTAKLKSGQVLILRIADEARFLISASVRCDRPGCLPILLAWMFGLRSDGLSEAPDVGSALATLCHEVESSKASWPGETSDAIIEAIAVYCGHRGEPGRNAIHAATASLRPKVAQAVVTGVALAQARAENAGLEEWVPQAPAAAGAYRGL